MIPGTLREWAVHEVLRYEGRPYIWGADNPMKGLFDCSGLQIHVLQTVGELPFGFDTTAAGLFARYRGVGKELKLPPFPPGCLVFFSDYSDPARIKHVEMVLGCDLAIGAAGGGDHTLTEADAYRQNAFVKIRPILGPHRPRFIFYADPFA